MVTTAEANVGNRGTPLEEYRVQVYYSMLDLVITEMKRRFDDVNTSLMKSMQALHPKSDKFLDLETLRPFMSHYDIDPDDFEVELMTPKRLLLNCTRKLNFLHHVYEQLLPGIPHVTEMSKDTHDL